MRSLKRPIQSRSYRRGFTLVELIIATVAGMLVSIDYEGLAPFLGYGHRRDLGTKAASCLGCSSSALAVVCLF